MSSYTPIGKPSVLKEFDEVDGQLMWRGNPVQGSGESGSSGRDGVDGFSPIVTVSEISGGHRITIIDAEHPSGQTVDVFNGTNGQDGVDGRDGSDGTNGSNGRDGIDGKDGVDGHDGVSPSVTVEEITGGHRVIITDEANPNGQSFDVLDGEAAQDQHSHENLLTLNKITEKSGMMAYNGKIVGVQFTNSIPPYNADLEYGRIIYFTGQTAFSSFHNGLLFYDKPNGWIQLTEESFSTWYRDHADTLAKITAPNGIPHYNGKSIYAYIREVLSSFVAQDGDLFIDTSIGHTAVDGNGDLLIDVDIAAQMADNEMEVFVCS